MKMSLVRPLITRRGFGSSSEKMTDPMRGGKGDYQIDYVPAPRITEANKNNDLRTLQRALDRRLYLLLYGNAYGAPSGKPVWHFPEKVYESEEQHRKKRLTAIIIKSVVSIPNKANSGAFVL
ncbi:unnamed protein product [Vicia faba]|uniref:Uncharacterized protein n=1 Tax=Vicia faba TaxID=3906 RepID=A0AAV1B1E1_VICFA|nr:unnamed protein product [Vicia faba]